MADVVEINAETGEITERDFTAEEIAQRTQDAMDQQDAAELAATEGALIAKATAAAIAHAKSLGFTDAMIAVMYPGLAS